MRVMVLQLKEYHVLEGIWLGACIAPHMVYVSKDLFITLKYYMSYRAGGTNGAGRAAALPVFVNFTIGCPTKF